MLVDPEIRRGLRVQTATQDGVHVLTLTGVLDMETLPTLESAISRLCRDGASEITLDMEDLSFIDSSGLWMITSANRWCTRAGCAFTLISPPEHIQRVFDVAGLSDVLPFRTDSASTLRT
jgi:anti-sigma B factor antagonist